MADVDCTAAGKALCSQHSIRGYPTLKCAAPPGHPCSECIGMVAALLGSRKMHVSMPNPTFDLGQVVDDRDKKNKTYMYHLQSILDILTS